MRLLTREETNEKQISIELFSSFWIGVAASGRSCEQRPARTRDDNQGKVRELTGCLQKEGDDYEPYGGQRLDLGIEGR